MPCETVIVTAPEEEETESGDTEQDQDQSPRQPTTGVPEAPESPPQEDVSPPPTTGPAVADDGNGQGSQTLETLEQDIQPPETLGADDNAFEGDEVTTDQVIMVGLGVAVAGAIGKATGIL